MRSCLAERFLQPSQALADRIFYPEMAVLMSELVHCLRRVAVGCCEAYFGELTDTLRIFIRADQPDCQGAATHFPHVPVINAYREILYFKQIPDFYNIGTAVILGIIVLFLGWFLFDPLQKGFAEEF